MHRFAFVIVPLSLLLPSASCVHSPSAPDAAARGGARLHSESGSLDGAAGGILLRSDQVATWCTCAPEPGLARVREGVGLLFHWSVVDPVAVDRFAEFRISIDGEGPSDWGDLRQFPEQAEGEPLTFWFPAAGSHTFRVEKRLDGVVTTLDAEFEVSAR